MPSLADATTRAPAGMAALDDTEMADVSGAGLALGFEDLRLETSPTGFIEATGAAVASGSAFERADVRWYGVTLAGAAGGTGTGRQFDGTPCSANDITCPISDMGFLVPNDNPLILRVWDYTGTSSAGRQYLLRDGSGDDVPTVLELQLPSWHEPIKASFWGEVAVGLPDGIAPEGGRGYPGESNPASGHFMQSQTVLDNVSLAGTNVRWFQFDQNDSVGGASDTTFGLAASLRVTGDMRFNVNQSETSPNQLGIVPSFTDREGLYFRNVSTYLPLGALHYQALVADQVPGGGDFILELTGIPNVPAVYEYFYAHAPNVAQHLGYERNNRPGRYELTHGHWRIGDGNPANNTCTGAASCDADDGVVFRSRNTASTFTVFSDRPSSDLDQWEDTCPDSTDCVEPPRLTNDYNASNFHQVNLGDVNVDGLLMHQLRITTCSSVSGPC